MLSDATANREKEERQCQCESCSKMRAVFAFLIGNFASLGEIDDGLAGGQMVRITKPQLSTFMTSGHISCEVSPKTCVGVDQKRATASSLCAGLTLNIPPLHQKRPMVSFRARKMQAFRFPEISCQFFSRVDRRTAYLGPAVIDRRNQVRRKKTLGLRRPFSKPSFQSSASRFRRVQDWLNLSARNPDVWEISTFHKSVAWRVLW